MNRRKVIVVTDGDDYAQAAVESAVKKNGGRCISLSAGNPTNLTGSEIAEQVMIAKHDPVVIMVDDNGNKDKGKGETALKSFASFPQIEIIGALAVASMGHGKSGIKVNCSISREEKKVESAVDKDGIPIEGNEIFGDTIDILNEINVPYVVGIGDPGKMGGFDDPSKGSPITTLAIKTILDQYPV